MNYLFLALCMSGALMTYPAFADIKGSSVEEDDEGVITKGKLMWMRCAMGQTWTRSTCTGKAKEYTWNQAMALRHSYAGHSDWRLPTIKELNSIRYCSKGVIDEGGESERCADKSHSPAINLKDFPNTPTAPNWSASLGVADNDFAWAFYFGYGNAFFSKEGNYYTVRLVRDH